MASVSANAPVQGEWDTNPARLRHKAISSLCPEVLLCSKCDIAKYVFTKYEAMPRDQLYYYMCCAPARARFTAKIFRRLPRS